MSFDYAVGILAGEGSFTLGVKKAHGKVYPNPTCVIRLKDNDEATLDVVQEAFDGAGSQHTSSGRDTRTWQVNGKSDLQYVADRIRDDAPEAWWESEKARNFRAWAEIVDIYTDGYNSSKDAVDMFRIAQDRLNIDNGRDVDWDEYIRLAQENEYGYVCGVKTGDDSFCQRRVSSSEETCWDH